MLYILLLKPAQNGVWLLHKPQIQGILYIALQLSVLKEE